MVDMGDLREGIMFDHYQDIVDTVKLINELPNLKLYGSAPISTATAR